MQGRLRNEYLMVTIGTGCSYSGKPIHIELDSQLKYRVLEEEARPMVFLPQIEWESFHDPNIIGAY